MIEILKETTPDILAIKAKGTLTHEDYEHFVPLLDATVREGKHIHMFVDLTEFEGWTAHAMLDDFLLGMKHWFNFKSMAVVGDNKWEAAVVKFFAVFMPCDIKFFDASERMQAWHWSEEKSVI